MPSIFLPGVEQAARSGPDGPSFDAMESAGFMVPPIRFLFAYKPAATVHLARYTQELMRGPSPLSAGQRELIAAFTSARNSCVF